MGPVLLAAAIAASAAPPPTKLPDGVYVVHRDGLSRQKQLPLEAGERLVEHHHRYLAKREGQPPRFVVVGRAPDVPLDLEGEPAAIKNGAEVVGISLKLKPKAAEALAKVTADNRGGQVALLIGGEVVTMHKVREPIRGGDVQITSCAPNGASFLLEQLRRQRAAK